MRKQVIAISVGVAFISSCDKPQAIPAPPNQEFVSISSVINNIKCELSAFQANYGSKLENKYQDIGGTLTFSVQSNISENPSLSAAIPVYPGVTLNLGAKHAFTNNYTSKVVLAVATTHDPKSAPADCSAVSRELETPDGNPIPLKGYLIGLPSLGDQIGRIIPGNPRIIMPAAEFTGSIVLTKSTTGSAGITAVVVSASVDKTKLAGYEIDYDISTDYAHLFSTMAPDAVVAPPAAPAADPKAQTSDVDKDADTKVKEGVKKPKPPVQAAAITCKLPAVASGDKCILPFAVPALEMMKMDPLVLPFAAAVPNQQK